MVVLVDGFISVQDGFIVGLLDGVEGTRSFVGFISSTDVEEDTYLRPYYKLFFKNHSPISTTLGKTWDSVTTVIPFLSLVTS